MTRLEIANVLNDIMIENNFSIIDRDNCHDKYSEKINSMQEIFHLKKSSDFTYLYAISHLLSDKEKSVDDYLISENIDSTFAKDVKLPTRDDLLLVATAFEENPEFFSMAWNWVVITEDRIDSVNNNIKNNNIILFTSISDLSKEQSISLDYSIEEIKFAASGDGEGWGENITAIPIDKLGQLMVLGDFDTKTIRFDLFIDQEYRKLKFEMIIEYETGNASKKCAVLRKDTKDEDSIISSIPSETIDFSNGLRIRKISWTPLQD